MNAGGAQPEVDPRWAKHRSGLVDRAAATAALTAWDEGTWRTSRPRGRRYPDAWSTWERLVTELRRRREAKQVSQAELARRVGVAPAFLGRLERGEADPCVSVVMALATELDLSLEDFLNAADPAGSTSRL